MTDASRGRLLLVTKTDFRSPRDGGTLRVAAIVRTLEQAGWAVDAVPVRGADGRARPSSGGRTGSRADVVRAALATARVASLTVARWFSPGVAAEIADLVRTRAYDAAVIEYSQLLIYRPLVRRLPILLDLHNIEAELLDNYAASATSPLRRMVARYEAARVRSLEQRMPRLVDAITTVSDHDADLVAELGTGRGAPGRPAAGVPVATAPNGVADEAFEVVKPTEAAAAAAPAPAPVVAFVAHLGWQPNVDAVEWLAGHVWPLLRARVPDARLQLIGRSPAAAVRRFAGADGVEVHADVESTLPYLRDAAVATAPLLAAGGTRLKVLEAMATGTPVVATSLGAMGLESRWGTDGLRIADDPESFADALAAAIADPPAPAAVREGAEAFRWPTALRAIPTMLDALADRVDGSVAGVVTGSPGEEVRDA